MPLLTSSFLRVPPSPSASPVCDISGVLGRRQQRTAAQTQNLDMIAQIRVRQRQQRRRKEHGFIIRMRDQKTDALVAQLGKSGVRDADRVQPGGDEDEGDGEDNEPLHIIEDPQAVRNVAGAKGFWVER